jgi:hypothetical protein
MWPDTDPADERDGSILLRDRTDATFGVAAPGGDQDKLRGHRRGAAVVGPEGFEPSLKRP